MGERREEAFELGRRHVDPGGQELAEELRFHREQLERDARAALVTLEGLRGRAGEAASERPEDWAPHYFLALLQRSSNPQDAKAELEAAGVRCVTVDLTTGDFGELPRDPSCVLDFAVLKSNRWAKDLAGVHAFLGLW